VLWASHGSLGSNVAHERTGQSASFSSAPVSDHLSAASYRVSRRSIKPICRCCAKPARTPSTRPISLLIPQCCQNRLVDSVRAPCALLSQPQLTTHALSTAGCPVRSSGSCSLTCRSPSYNDEQQLVGRVCGRIRRRALLGHTLLLHP
jgi:hypothetical protein